MEFYENFQFQRWNGEKLYFTESINRWNRLHRHCSNIPYVRNRGCVEYRTLLKELDVRGKRTEIYEKERWEFQKRTGKQFYCFEPLDWSDTSWLAYTFMGLRFFSEELKTLPLEVECVITGHGASSGNYPNNWMVSGQCALSWADKFGPILIHACETPILRFAGTFDGRIIYPS